MRAQQIKWTGPMNPKPHPMVDGRHVPIRMLAKRLHVLDYDLPAPLLKREIMPGRLVLPLKQSAGTACLPKIKKGDRVKAAQIIGEPASDALGAILHAPIAGVIREANAQQIILEKL